MVVVAPKSCGKSIFTEEIKWWNLLEVPNQNLCIMSFLHNRSGEIIWIIH